MIAVVRDEDIMVVEQILKEWMSERDAAVDLAVAARSLKSVAAEIEAHYAAAVERARAQANNSVHQLTEKEGALHRALEVARNLEGQLSTTRDRTDRIVAERDRQLERRDQAISAQAESLKNIEAQFAQIRTRLEVKVDRLETKLEERTEALGELRGRVKLMERELKEKEALLEKYRKKFGVIVQAVQ